MIHTIIALEDIFAADNSGVRGADSPASPTNGLRARNFSTNPRDFLDNKFV